MTPDAVAVGTERSSRTSTASGGVRRFLRVVGFWRREEGRRFQIFENCIDRTPAVCKGLLPFQRRSVPFVIAPFAKILSRIVTAPGKTTMFSSTILVFCHVRKSRKKY